MLSVQKEVLLRQTLNKLPEEEAVLAVEPRLGMGIVDVLLLAGVEAVMQCRLLQVQEIQEMMMLIIRQLQPMISLSKPKMAHFGIRKHVGNQLGDRQLRISCPLLQVQPNMQ